jgi:hypothetical protein
MKRVLISLLLTLIILSGLSAAQSLSKDGPVEGLPRIVARMKLTNQSGFVPPTVIFTPKTSGLFRASMVIVVKKRKTEFYLGWLDGIIEYSDVIRDTVRGASANTQYLGSSGEDFTMTFAAKGGKPFKFYTMSQFDITGAVYDVFLVIERLTKIPSF